MRWVRTVVLPVPAPATTSTGPCRCSIASRWRSSGWNADGDAMDFNTATGWRITEMAEDISAEQQCMQCKTFDCPDGLFAIDRADRSVRPIRDYDRCSRNRGCLGTQNRIAQ